MTAFFPFLQDCTVPYFLYQRYLGIVTLVSPISCLEEHLIHTNDRVLSDIRALIYIQHLFHGGYKLTVGSRWDYPTLYLPRFQFVFFRTFLTVSWQILST